MERQDDYEIMKHKMQREFASHDLYAAREEWELESGDDALTLTLLCHVAERLGAGRRGGIGAAG